MLKGMEQNTFFFGQNFLWEDMIFVVGMVVVVKNDLGIYCW